MESKSSSTSLRSLLCSRTSVPMSMVNDLRALTLPRSSSSSSLFCWAKKDLVRLGNFSKFLTTNLLTKGVQKGWGFSGNFLKDHFMYKGYYCLGNFWNVIQNYNYTLKRKSLQCTVFKRHFRTNTERAMLIEANPHKC